jgi:exodeoxyribonuclease V beta subunit
MNIAAETPDTDTPLDWRTLDLHGKNLIEASAGTGKTFTLMLLVLRLVLERELPLSAILLSTYTEAATAELRERIGARVKQAYAASLAANEAGYQAIAPEDPLARYLAQRWLSTSRKKSLVRLRDQQLLARALADVGDMPVRTLHGFCRQILTGFDLDATAADAPVVDADALNDAAIDDAIRRQFVDVAELPPILRDCLDDAFLQRLRSSMKRVLLYGRIRMRTPLRVDPDTYQHARQQLFQEHTRDALFAVLRDPEHAIRLRAPQKFALQTLLSKFAQDAHQALPKAALLAFAEPNLQTQKARIELGAVSSSAAALVSFAQLAERAWRGEFAHLLNVLCAQVRLACNSELRTRAALSFEAMIDRVADRLAPQVANAGARRAAAELAAAIYQRFPVALIDEFQDSDTRQWAILRALYGKRGGLILVGDPKQAIYRFRGSDVHTFMRAKAECLTFQLRHNYRAGPALLAATNAFYSGATNPFFSAQLPYRAALVGRTDDKLSAGLHFIEVSSAQIEADPLQLCLSSACDALSAHYRAAQQQASAPRFAMLLARNSDVQQAQQLLAARGVQAQAKASAGVFQSDAAALLLCLLDAFLQPAHTARARSAFLRLGLQDFADIAELPEDDLLQFSASGARLWRTRGVAALCMQLCAQVQIARCTPPLLVPDFAQLEVDAKHLAECLSAWQTASQRTEKNLAANSVEQHQAWHQQASALRAHLADCIADVTMRSDNTTRRRWRQSASVQLMTVHAAKGLEFDVVYLPTLWFARAPDTSLAIVPGTEGLECDSGSAQFATAIVQEGDEVLRELLRLQYVALTRAREQVFVFYSEAALRFRNQRNALQWHLEAAEATPVELSWAEQMQQAELAQPLWRSGLQALSQKPNLHWEVRTAQPAEPVAQPVLTMSQAHVNCETQGIEWPDALAARRTRKRLSFSAITQPQARDEAAIEPKFAWELEAIAEIAAIADTVQPDQSHSDSPNPEIMRLSQFRGPGFGQALHALFEHSGEALTSAQIQARMAQFPITPPMQEADALIAVAQLLQRCRNTPLLPGFSLAQLRPEQCAVELGFQLPITQLSLTELAELGPKFGLPKLFLPAQTNLKTVDGFLVGFIDLVFQHAGRFYLLDYKSNWLGSALNDYTPSALARAMDAHHYHLQYLLYALALHRYLKVSLPGYDYAQHFGGAHYVFVRAFGLDSAVGHYFYRPDAALIAQLDALF